MSTIYPSYLTYPLFPYLYQFPTTTNIPPNSSTTSLVASSLFTTTSGIKRKTIKSTSTESNFFIPVAIPVDVPSKGHFSARSIHPEGLPQSEKSAFKPFRKVEEHKSSSSKKRSQPAKKSKLIKIKPMSPQAKKNLEEYEALRSSQIERLRVKPLPYAKERDVCRIIDVANERLPLLQNYWSNSLLFNICFEQVLFHNKIIVLFRKYVKRTQFDKNEVEIGNGETVIGLLSCDDTVQSKKEALNLLSLLIEHFGNEKMWAWAPTEKHVSIDLFKEKGFIKAGIINKKSKTSRCVFSRMAGT